MRLPSNEIPEELIGYATRETLRFCNELHPLSSETQREIAENHRYVLYSPREVILDYGQVCNYSFICVQGLVAASVIVEDRDKIVWFRGSDEIIVSADSWYRQAPSEEKLTALNRTLLAGLSYHAIQRLIEDRRDFQRMYTRLIERQFIMSDRQSKWHQLPTDLKIEELVALNPELIDGVPNTKLANYLGITRESLGRKRRARETGDEQ